MTFLIGVSLPCSSLMAVNVKSVSYDPALHQIGYRVLGAPLVSLWYNTACDRVAELS